MAKIKALVGCLALDDRGDAGSSRRIRPASQTLSSLGDQRRSTVLIALLEASYSFKLLRLDFAPHAPVPRPISRRKMSCERIHGIALTVPIATLLRAASGDA